MIGHEQVGIDANRLRRHSLGQHVQERPVICIGEENRGPVNAAQNGVERKAGCDDTGMSGPEDLFA